MVISNVNIVIGVISLLAAVIYSGQSALFVQKLNELFHWKAGCNPSSSVGNVSLHYFAGRGRGEAIRLLLEDYLIPYTETKYTKETWPEAKETGISAGIYIFGQVPAIITSKNKHLVQSKVILQFLGRSVGLDCDCKDLEKCDMIAAGVDDLHQKRSRIMYNPEFSHGMRDQFVHEILPTWLRYFENLAPHDGLYFAGDRLTWVDYLVFDMLESNCNFIEFTTRSKNGEIERTQTECEETLGKFQRLEAFFKYFQTHENLITYFNSERRPVYTIPYEPK